MYKPSKLEQKLFQHIRIKHMGFVRPDCKECQKMRLGLDKNSKKLA
jgi:hypothetical protein